MTKQYTAGEHARVIRADSLFNAELGKNQVGLVGTVMSPGSWNGAYLTFPHTGEQEFYFNDEELEPIKAAEPKPAKFKEGDWVKVVGYTESWDGTVGQVKAVNDGGLHITSEKYVRGLWFPIENFELTEKPAEPHWTETKPVHTSARAGQRTIVKVDADRWLFLYSNDYDTSKLASVRYRSNKDTKIVTAGEDIQFLEPADA